MTATLVPPFTGRLRDELRTLVKLALPIAFAQVALVSMGLVDTAIVGHTNPYDLGATAMGRSLSFGALSLCMGLATAVEPLSAQALGAGDARRAYSAFRTSLRASVALAVPTLLVCFALTLALAKLGVESSLVPRVRLFLLGAAPGTLCYVVFLTAKNFLQTHDDTRPALVAAIAANVINLVACALLVLGDGALAYVGLPPVGLPRLGPLGAGLATSISSAFLAAYTLRAAERHRPLAMTSALGSSLGGVPSREAHYREGLFDERFVPVRMSEVLALGLPVGLSLFAEIGAFSVAAVLAGRLGPVAVSAHQIAVGLATCSFMAASGVSGATATRVGHAIGAGVSPGRVGALGMALGVGVMATSALVFSRTSHALVGLFTSDGEVIAVGAQLVLIASWFQLFDGLQTVASGALRGASDVRFPLFANGVAHWMVGFPLALYLAFGKGMGAPGLWWGLTAGLVAVSVALAARFWRVAMKHRGAATGSVAGAVH